jgi:hypothetical protein
MEAFQRHLMLMAKQINDPSAVRANAGKLEPALSGRITRANFGFKEVSK